jgi:hypothetical protein
LVTPLGAVFPLGRFILHHDERAPGASRVQLNSIAPMKSLPVLNPNAAGLDVGSEQFHLSIAGDAPVVFGTFTDEVYRLRDYLKAQGATSVAMEATGVYWLYAYAVLEAAGLEVVVVNGRHVRNLPGRKTDMADCQWLATLHAHGLLRGGFVPPAAIRRLQDYQRLRADHLIGAGSQRQRKWTAWPRACSAGSKRGTAMRSACNSARAAWRRAKLSASAASTRSTSLLNCAAP